MTVEPLVLLERLREMHPTARYELNWSTPVQMLVATILAAQCTDERVNAVTETLFVRWPDAEAFANADRSELEEAVRPTGFYKQKARSVQEACRALVDRFGGERHFLHLTTVGACVHAQRPAHRRRHPSQALGPGQALGGAERHQLGEVVRPAHRDAFDLVP